MHELIHQTSSYSQSASFAGVYSLKATSEGVGKLESLMFIKPRRKKTLPKLNISCIHAVNLRTSHWEWEALSLIFHAVFQHERQSHCFNINHAFIIQGQRLEKHKVNKCPLRWAVIAKEKREIDRHIVGAGACSQRKCEDSFTSTPQGQT